MSVSVDNVKKLRPIGSKVKSAIEEGTNTVYYYCPNCQTWVQGQPNIEIVVNLERRGNKYSCGICDYELKFEQTRRVHHGM